jgi:ATP-dependent Clp protease ATP-binding subunit ClpB
MFAELSGHGKTELAKNFGDMSNVKFCPIESTKLTYEWEVFGSSASFAEHGDGSQLNNFLAENSGLRSVVFVDEFCRSTEAVYKTLLEVLDTGEEGFAC